MRVKFDDLDICHECTVVIVNGDDSADPERAAAAYEHAYGVWGDDLRHLVMACSHEDEECPREMFRCDYCEEDTYDWKHTFAILEED